MAHWHWHWHWHWHGGQVHSSVDERGQSIAVNFWHEELMGVDVDTDERHQRVCQQAAGDDGGGAHDW